MKHKLVLYSSFLSITFCFISIAFGQWTQPDGGAFNYGETGFAVIGTNIFASSGEVGVGRSTDYGVTWYVADSGLYTQEVQALGVNGTSLFAGIYPDGIYRSTDSGSFWTSCGDSTLPLSVQVFDAVGSYLFVGTTEGLFFSSDNGTSWQPNALSYPGVYSLCFSGNTLIAGTPEGIFISTDTGASWINVGPGSTDSSVASLVSVGHSIFASTGSGIIRSTDEGINWMLADSGIPQNSYLYEFASSGSNLFAATFTSVYLTTNNGMSWTDVGNGLSGYDTISALAVSGGYLFAGTFIRGIYRRPLSEMINSNANDTESVQLSDTGTFNLALAGDSDQSRSNRIDFVNSSSDTLTILNATLTDSNNRFSISQFLPGVPDTVLPGDTFSMIVNFFGDTSGTIYLDTIVLTIDPNAIITSYFVYLKGKSFSSGNSGVAPIAQIPASDFQIYPNPLSQLATVQYSSTDREPTEIIIVNLLGQEVARLFDGELDAGVHSFTWDASGVSPGTYWCFVRCGGKVERVALSVLR